MTRAECEAKLMELTEAMVDILHEYAPGSKYLSSFYTEICGEPCICINNSYYEEDAMFPVNCHKLGFRPMESDAV